MESIEELEKLLTAETRPRERIEALIKLKVLLRGSNFPYSHRLCTEAVQLATALGDPLLLGHAHRHLANVLWRMGENQKAQEQFAISLDIFKEQNDNEGLTHVYCGLGIIHGTIGDGANAIDFFEKGIVVAKRWGDEHMLAHLYGNIGNVHLKLQDHITALRYFAKALSMYRELDAEGLDGVANMLGSIAGVLVHQGEYGNAIEHLEQALEIEERIGDDRSTPVRLMNLGITYFKAGQFTTALDYLKRSLERGEKSGAGAYFFMVHEQLAEVYSAMGETQKAMEHMNLYQSYKIAETRNALNRNARDLM